MILINVLNNKKGAISIVTILILSVLISVFLFLMLEYTANIKIKHEVSNSIDYATRKALFQLDEIKLKNGDLNILEDEANQIIKDVLIHDFNLNSDLSPTEMSNIQTPFIKTYIWNNYDESGFLFVTDEGIEYTLYEPSVMVYIEAKPKTTFGKMTDALITKDVKKSINFKYNKEIPLNIWETTDTSTNGINFYMEGVVNPYYFNDDNPFENKQWIFDKIPMLADSKFFYAFDFKDNQFRMNNATVTMNIDGVDKNGDFYRYSEDQNINNQILGGDLILDEVESTESFLSGWKITNPYSTDIVVSWIGIGGSGKVVAKADTDTYFQINGNIIIAFTYGRLLTNGINFNFEPVLNPSPYPFVDNNNGEDVVNNRTVYRSGFIIPKDAPKDANISIKIDAEGFLPDSQGDITTYSFNEASVGYVQDNIHNMLLVK